jgi:chromosomal replication initiation ATPase DnaA
MLPSRRGTGNNGPIMSHPQLPLPFPHHPTYTAADFLAAPSNEAALAWLERTEQWPEHRLALWGAAGCGKTHLLRLWAGRRGATLLASAARLGLPPVPTSGGIAIDDADAIGEEAGLLHLLNAAREAKLPVVLAARTAPARWPVHLPDLGSRLRAITAVEILPPEEALLRALLLRLLSDRQLAVTPGLQQWLLVRLPRSPAALREAVARLDRAALAAGGAINRAVAARVLGELDDEGRGET